MIPVVFPYSLNWFYHAQAISIADDLSAHGQPARPVASSDLATLAGFESRRVLFVSFAECLFAAERSGVGFDFLQAADGFADRILLNFDSIHSPWFGKQLNRGRGYFSAILDIGLFRQTDQEIVGGSRFCFVPESFAAAETRSLAPWTPGRPIPWTVLGHLTRDRSALVEALLQCLPTQGFVFTPHLRAFTAKSGLDRSVLHSVLARSDLYVWGSHHNHPYHETQRALHAVAAGAVPVKIDPLHHRSMRIPWVYPSVEAMLAERDRRGLDGLYASARDFVLAQGTIGANIKAALERLDENATPRQARTGAGE